MKRLAVPLLLSLLAACQTYAPRAPYGWQDEPLYAGDDWEDEDPNGRLDPWLEETEEGRLIVHRALGRGGWSDDDVARLNGRFRFFADTDGNRRLTDEEIRLALVRCARDGWR